MDDPSTYSRLELKAIVAVEAGTDVALRLKRVALFELLARSAVTRIVSTDFWPLVTNGFLPRSRGFDEVSVRKEPFAVQFFEFSDFVMALLCPFDTVTRDEFDDTVCVVGSPFFCAQDLKSLPGRTFGPNLCRFSIGARPVSWKHRCDQEVDGLGRVGDITRRHEIGGGLGLLFAADKGETVGFEGFRILERDGHRRNVVHPPHGVEHEF